MTRKAISNKDIHDAREKISKVVSESVVETFNTMFGQSVTAEDLGKQFGADKSVYSAIKLQQGEVVLEFCFRFDIQLLLKAASLIFTKEYLEKNPVHEDIACEIANIVCSKVKAFLNDSGYDTEMGFPFIPLPDRNPMLKNTQTVHMHFYYDGSEGKGVGVAVNFFTGDQAVTG